MLSSFAQGTCLRWLSGIKAFALKVSGRAFGDPLLLWQKGAKPSVPAKLGGCCVMFGCRACAKVAYFAETGRTRTIAGTFTVANGGKGQRLSKAKARLAS